MKRNTTSDALPKPLSPKAQRRRRMNRIITLVAVALMAAGICMLGYHFYTRWLEDKDTQEIVQNIEDGKLDFEVPFIPDDPEDLDYYYISDDPTPSASAAPEVSPSPAPQTVKLSALGTIVIDKINCRLPILEGATTTSLRYGVGRWTGTGEIGQVGNCILAGHRSYTYGRMFNRLGEMAAGDIIRIILPDKSELQYEVFETEIVNPGDLKVLKSSAGEKWITLLTCHPVRVASHRLLIRAKLVEDAPAPSPSPSPLPTAE